MLNHFTKSCRPLVWCPWHSHCALHDLPNAQQYIMHDQVGEFCDFYRAKEPPYGHCGEDAVHDD